MTLEHIKTFMDNLRLGEYTNCGVYTWYSDKDKWYKIQVSDQKSGLIFSIKACIMHKNKVVQVVIGTSKPFSNVEEGPFYISPELYDSVASYAIENCTTEILARETNALEIFNLCK